MKLKTALLIVFVTCVLVLSSVANASIDTLSWQGQSWHPYSGRGALGQSWSPSHVALRGTDLVETVSGGVAGGVSDRTRTFTYGTFALTYQMTPGVGSKYVALLCARTRSGACRPEIDFAEDPKGDSTRTRLTATLHYSTTTNSNVMIHRSVGCICSKPTTAGVVWQRGRLSFTLNGRIWGTIVSSHVPTVPMKLTIQTSQYQGKALSVFTASRLVYP